MRSVCNGVKPGLGDNIRQALYSAGSSCDVDEIASGSLVMAV